MFVLFKKRIAVDTSNEEISRVTTILDQNNIKYELLTKRTRGVYGSAYDARSYAGANVAMYKGSTQPTFIYMVYVKRRDYARAHEILFTC